jgi:hypothetical protein
MKIVADNREKKRGNYDDFVLVKRFERGERERERERFATTTLYSYEMFFFLKKGKCFPMIRKGKHFPRIKV